MATRCFVTRVRPLLPALVAVAAASACEPGARRYVGREEPAKSERALEMAISPETPGARAKGEEGAPPQAWRDQTGDMAMAAPSSPAHAAGAGGAARAPAGSLGMMGLL